MSYANYSAIRECVRGCQPFTGNSARAVINSDGDYLVYSYGTIVAMRLGDGDRVFVSQRKYSQTTSRLQNIVRSAWQSRGFEFVESV